MSAEQRRIPLVDLAGLHAEYGEELEAAVLRVCRNQRFVGGEEIERFEAEFAAYTGAPHAVGVANGTDALELVLLAFGVGPGDEVIVPGNTFIATAEAVAACGASVRFADIDPASGLAAPAGFEPLITSRTRALIPVHIYGRLADMASIMELAASHSLRVIEDAAQAHGARRDGVHAGCFAHAGTFSFYPGKNLGAFGDAGAIVTADSEVAANLRKQRDHGRHGRDNHELVGRNSRLDAIQAAVLRAKLPHLDDWTARRRRVAERYRDELPPPLLDWRPGDPAAESHHVFPVLTEDRDRLAEDLAGAGIATAVHYREALPSTQAFAAVGDACPAAVERARTQLSLPISPHISDADVERVVAAVRSYAEASEAAPIGPVGGRST